MQHLKNTLAAIGILGALFCTQTAFSQQPAVLTGVIDSATDGMRVYIQTSSGHITRTTIKDNAFQFSIPAGNLWDEYIISYTSKAGSFNLPIILKQASVMEVKINSRNDKFTITGDSSAQQQNSFWQGYAAIFSDYNATEQKMKATANTAAVKQLQAKIKAMETEAHKYLLHWVEAHTSSPFSCVVIHTFIDQTNIKRALDTVATKYYDMLTLAAKQNNNVAAVVQREFALYNPDYSNYRPGTVITSDITLKDTAGNTIGLNNIKGKYILIDFWASWCGPCRANAPLLKKLYSQYNSKGLEIFSISIDTSASKWKDAIVKDGMQWPNGSDFKGFDDGVAIDLQIQAIPHYILISADKKVILNNHDLPAQEKKLNQLFKGKQDL